MLIVIIIALAVHGVLNVPLESTVIAENGDIIKTTTNEFKKSSGNQYYEQRIVKQERTGRPGNHFEQQFIAQFASVNPFEVGSLKGGNFGDRKQHGNIPPERRHDERNNLHFDKIFPFQHPPDINTHHHIHGNERNGDYGDDAGSPTNFDQRNNFSSLRNSNANVNEPSEFQDATLINSNEGENRKIPSMNRNDHSIQPAAKDKQEEIKSSISGIDHTADRLNNGDNRDGGGVENNVGASRATEIINNRRSHQDQNKSNDKVKPEINTSTEKLPQRSRIDQEVDVNDGFKVILNKDDSSSDTLILSNKSRTLVSEKDDKIYFEPMLHRNSTKSDSDSSIMKIKPASASTKHTTTTSPTEPITLDNRNAFDVNVTCEPGMVSVNNVCVETPY